MQEESIIRIGMSICILFIAIVVVYIIKQGAKRGINCSRIKNYTAPTISSIGPKDAQYDLRLRDYYIKSSYNSCASGQFQNDFVDLCALNNVIKQGCRVLDFEIYNMDGVPAIATSNSIKFTEKGTYNWLQVEDVIQAIADTAISTSRTTDQCPNSNDPLFLHFRFKTDEITIYNNIANILAKYLDPYMLSDKHSYENQGKNLGNIPLKSLLGKVIIMVDKGPIKKLEMSTLDEFVNLAGNSVFMRSLSYSDVVHAPDMDELIDYNKKNMTFCYPNLSAYSNNYNSSISMQYGAQMSAMCFQNNDTLLQAYNELFNTQGNAFILKPANLRYVPVTVDPPPPINPDLSYGYKTHKTNYYNFNL